jgi:hypothetical protein
MRRSWGSLALLLILLSASVAYTAIATTVITVYGKTIIRAQPLVNAVAIGNGEWIDTSGVSTMSIHITGITNATVEVNGSDEAIKPADATHGAKLNASDIIANQMFIVEAPMRWTKVRVTAWTSGTINAYVEAHVGGR